MRKQIFIRKKFLSFYLVANLLEESCSSKRGEITITSTDLESSQANVWFRCNLFTWWCLPQGQLGLVDKTWQQSRNGMALGYNHMHFLNTLSEKIFNIKCDPAYDFCDKGDNTLTTRQHNTHSMSNKLHTSALYLLTHTVHVCLLMLYCSTANALLFVVCSKSI